MPCRDEYADQEAREDLRREHAKQKAMLCFVLRYLGATDRVSPYPGDTDKRLVSNVIDAFKETPMTLALEERCGVSTSEIASWFVNHLKEDAARLKREARDAEENQKKAKKKEITKVLESLTKEELADLLKRVKSKKA